MISDISPTKATQWMPNYLLMLVVNIYYFLNIFMSIQCYIFKSNIPISSCTKFIGQITSSSQGKRELGAPVGDEADKDPDSVGAKVSCIN